MEDHLCEQRPPDSLLMLPPLVSRHSLPLGFSSTSSSPVATRSGPRTRLWLWCPSAPASRQLLPVQLFGSEVSRSLREKLQRHLRIVIEHGHTWPNLHPSFRIHMAVFKKACDDHEATASPLRFFRIPAEVEDKDQSLAADVDADLADLLARKGGRTRWGFVLREGLPLGEPWVYDLYSPKSEALQKDLRDLGELRPLAELADFVRTIHPSTRRGFVGGRRRRRGCTACGRTQHNPQWRCSVGSDKTQDTRNRCIAHPRRHLSPSYLESGRHG